MENNFIAWDAQTVGKVESYKISKIYCTKKSKESEQKISPKLEDKAVYAPVKHDGGTTHYELV